ncbi:AraC family transcriptional regulator [Cellulophaga sp. E16_2]|uniref:AraC family transcriptional regulator n=1 Tax=Cellulophaga sp. E16_2 TaxID=2789297 RepID=UPI001A91B5D9|nr:AraC family transcriptional regulator [Cellulophaga sp. E16_2]MBO0590253.1 AraC family transcriptional regulator [Cellulophaga sp. E16_2]
MKLHLLNRSSTENKSLTVSHHIYNNFLKIWHYHEELELVIILKSSGMRFVGDSIEKFDVGDVVLIGRNLPHMWLNDDTYFKKNSTSEAEAISIHFKKNFLGEKFLEVPETEQIVHLLNLADRGIKFSNLDDVLLINLKLLAQLDATSQMIKLLEILNNLSSHSDYTLLSSAGFLSSFHKTENKRLDKIYEYVFQNFNTPISSGDVAATIGMNKSAFSRFFKKTHRKPFTKYLNEIRIGYACKLLIENKESITAIAYLCGFNNISNFNRQFKLLKSTSPSTYLEFYSTNKSKSKKSIT